MQAACQVGICVASLVPRVWPKPCCFGITASSHESQAGRAASPSLGIRLLSSSVLGPRLCIGGSCHIQEAETRAEFFLTPTFQTHRALKATCYIPDLAKGAHPGPREGEAPGGL